MGRMCKGLDLSKSQDYYFLLLKMLLPSLKIQRLFHCTGCLDIVSVSDGIFFGEDLSVIDSKVFGFSLLSFPT